MKTKKLNSKTLTEAAIVVLGGTLGFMVSGAIDAVVPQDKQMIARVGTAGAGTAGAALLPSTDNLSLALKSASAGAATRAATLLIQSQVKGMVTQKATPGTLDKAIAGAVGLACPGDGYGLGNPIPYPQLNAMPIMETTYNEDQDAYEVDANQIDIASAAV